MSDRTKALRLNHEADPAHIADPPNSRLGQHHMDLARAWLWDDDRDQALTESETAERIAPQLVRNHPVAHATLRPIICAERAATRKRLRGMTGRFSLDRPGDAPRIP
ncbi:MULTISPECIES: hypothetical protein [Streptomyces]|uniref:hypothetical protein n=1 Tax=Streptomyces TaxID=1883 RepID=UPI0004C70025|nr:hypothetical protein [Streptomyces sp. NRRL S-237]